MTATGIRGFWLLLLGAIHIITSLLRNSSRFPEKVNFFFLNDGSYPLNNFPDGSFSWLISSKLQIIKQNSSLRFLPLFLKPTAKTQQAWLVLLQFTSLPVSYTHLDVYKRQTLHSNSNIEPFKNTRISTLSILPPFLPNLNNCQLICNKYQVKKILELKFFAGVCNKTVVPASKWKFCQEKESSTTTPVKWNAIAYK